MRGKRCRPEYRPHAHRIIPARAGQTSSIWRDSSASTDHPRACGANSFFLSSHVLGFGSSPRVRGKRVVRVPGRLPARIIPARAGQTARRCRAAPERPDHPRACGANGKAFHTEENLPGSSPRVRGKRPVRVGVSAKRRIIPARAGQTPSGIADSSHRADHPRACGANSSTIKSITVPSGSSPRVRGKLVLGVVGLAGSRIIPARAGQTHVNACKLMIRPDHPRACGANSFQPPIIGLDYGSSPRVRGKRPRSRRTAHHQRIIPARAGQTTHGHAGNGQGPDHPRACGANVKCFSINEPEYGSSPRVRGKQSDFMRKLLSAGPSIIGFAQWLQSSCYCSCFQSSAKTPISRGTTPTSLFLGFQNSITLLLLT